MRAAGLTAGEIHTLVHGPEKAAVLAKIQAALYVGDTPGRHAGGAVGGRDGGRHPHRLVQPGRN